LYFSKARAKKDVVLLCMLGEKKWEEDNVVMRVDGFLDDYDYGI